MPEPSAAARNFVMKIPADRIEPNKFNPNVMSHESYAALKADILRGDYDPIVVSPKNVFYSDNSLPRDRYVIVDGEHRWRGCLDLGISDVAAISGWSQRRRLWRLTIGGTGSEEPWTP